jgi:cytochrome P450
MQNLVPVSHASLGTVREAPRPPGLPLLGQLLDAWRDPISLFLSARSAFGGVVKFRFGPYDYFLVNDLRAIKHVLVDNAKNYVKSRNYGGLKILLGEGLLTSEGDFWKRQRRLSQPAFHREHLAGFATTMAQETERMLGRWSAIEPGTCIDVHAEMMRLTFAIVGQTLLSTDVDDDSSAIGEALDIGLKWTNDYAEALVRIPPWVPTPANARYRKARRTLDDLIYRIIEERRKQADPGSDLLGMLMRVVGEGEDDRMNDRQLRDELMTLVLAGHETTANLLAFAFHALSTHPYWLEATSSEVETVLEGRTPTLADMPKMKITRMVLDETLRLYPPAWTFERQSLEEDVIGGFRLPKGGIVGISPYALHRDPSLWENPEGFDPMRFSPERSEGRHKFAYLPFGGGPRTCIGNAFAMMEATIILAMVLQKHRLARDPAQPLVLDPMVTLRPKKGLYCHIRNAEAKAPKAPALAG